MSENGLCKGCLESVMVSQEVIDELLKEAMEDESLLVDQEVYQERLNVCNSCSSLQYRTTCGYSGCIVQYRAKFKDNQCPAPSFPKWHRI